MRRRQKHAHHAIATIGHAARSAHAELAHRGLPETARAVAVLGGATMAIGSHVRGWASEIGGLMRPAIGTSAHKALGPKRKRRAGTKRRKLTAKQIAAGFGGKRRKGHKKKAHRGAHKTRKRHHFTAAQKRAGFGGKRAMHGRKRRKGPKRKR